MTKPSPEALAAFESNAVINCNPVLTTTGGAALWSALLEFRETQDTAALNDALFALAGEATNGEVLAHVLLDAQALLADDSSQSDSIPTAPSTPSE